MRLDQAKNNGVFNYKLYYVKVLGGPAANIALEQFLSWVIESKDKEFEPETSKQSKRKNKMKAADNGRNPTVANNSGNIKNIEYVKILKQ